MGDHRGVGWGASTVSDLACVGGRGGLGLKGLEKRESGFRVQGFGEEGVGL